MAKSTAKTETKEAADIDLDAMLADLDVEEVIETNESPKEKAKQASSPDTDLDELLDELDLEEAAPVEAKNATDNSVDLDELEALLEETTPADIKVKDNSELYAEDEVNEVVEAAPETKESEVETNKKKASKIKDDDATKKPSKKATAKKSKPKAEKVDPGLPASEQLVARLGESGKSLLELEDGVHLDMSVVDAMPKKVKEKLHNLFAHLHNGSSVSTYTSRGLSVIVSNGEATTAKLIENYQEKWSKGTSASQVGQIVRLFKDLKICTVDNKTLKPNSKSKLLPLIKIDESEGGEA